MTPDFNIQDRVSRAVMPIVASVPEHSIKARVSLCSRLHPCGVCTPSSMIACANRWARNRAAMMRLFFGFMAGDVYDRLAVLLKQPNPPATSAGTRRTRPAWLQGVFDGGTLKK